MPKYEVTLNEIMARTYRVEAEDPEHAIEVAKTLEDPEAHIADEEWLDYWGGVTGDDVVELPPGN